MKFKYCIGEQFITFYISERIVEINGARYFIPDEMKELSTYTKNDFSSL